MNALRPAKQRAGRMGVGRPGRPVCRLAACMTVLLLVPGLAMAQEAKEEPAYAEPADGAFVQPSVSAATQPATTGPATSLPATTEPAPPTTTATAQTQPAATLPATRWVPATRRVPSLPAAVGTPISLNFRDASLTSVLDYLSETAGLVIVEEARVDGRVTVLSRHDISVDEAVSLLDTVLKGKGYAAIRNGRTLKIVTIDQAKKELIPVRSGTDPNKIQPSDRIVTQIIPIRFAEAARLRTDLASLIPTGTDVAANAASNTLIVTGTEATIRRILEIIRAIDVHMSEVSQVKVFQLKYANSANAARLITEIFREDQARQGASTPSGFGGGRRGFMFPGMPDGPGGPGGPGRGDGGQRDEAGGRGVKVTASADERTNTLVVSASPDVMKVIEGVVKELDANPAEEQAVFIYRLKNAQAKNLEAVLNSIFGWGGTGTTGTMGRQTSGTGFGTGGFGAGGFGTGGSGTGGTFGGRTSSSGSRGLGSSSMGGQTSGRTTGGRTGAAAQSRVGSAFGTARTPSRATAAGASDLAGQVYVVADEDTNSLVVTAASKYFERVKTIIGELDRAVPQVLIKVLIAEVTHDKSVDLGVEFSGTNIRASGKGFEVGNDFSVAAQTGGFMFKLDEKNVTAAVRAIAGVGKLDVLSRPYILTGDNQQASIMVGQEVPFIVNTRTTDTGQTINTIEYDDIGIILNVTPHINPQGLVTLDVYPEISTITGETVPISETVRAPVFAKRFAQTRLAVRDGQTIVIGGLMEDRNTKSVEKVPFLGDMPGLGLLFQRTIEKKTKTELLIFLTPHVAEEPDQLKGMSDDERAGAKVIHEAVEPGAFEDHLRGLQRGAASQPAPEGAKPRPADDEGDPEPAGGDADEMRP